MTCGPVVGKVLSTGLECLYEQCSDQRAENTPSSVNVGTRPSISTMRLYSMSLRLCSRTSADVMGGSPGSEIASVVDPATLVAINGVTSTRVAVFLRPPR